MRRWFSLVVALTCSIAVGGSAIAADPGTPGSRTTTLDGTLRVVHIDDFAGGNGRDAFLLETATETLPLEISGPVPEELSGARVRVRGTRAGGRVRVALGRDPASLTRLRAAPTRRTSVVLAADGQTVFLADTVEVAASAARNVAVILFNFSDDTSQPYTPATANAVMFTSANSVKNYFEEESRGAVSVDGQVFGWYTLANSWATCDWWNWATNARAAATAAGADLSGFTNFVYAFPRATSCGGWVGLGEVPGSQTWNNGAFSLRILAHELGHNFGVHHASSLSCTSGGVRVAISSTCTSSEYGDPFTVMGAAASAHDHALHLGQFGWLPSSEVRTVGPGGPYELGSVLDGPAGSSRLLRIARGNGTWFYLDLRSVHGPYFDNFSPTAPAVTGVTVRISPDSPSPTWSPSQTQLVDTTPGTSTFADAPLVPGGTLLDPVSGLEIAVASVGIGVASVNVNDRVAPSAPTGLSAVAPDTTLVDLSWTAATDNMAVTGYRVLRDGVEVGAPTATSFQDAGLAASTTYAYQVSALDAFGNAGPAASVSISTPATTPPPSPPPPPPPAADTTRPTAPGTLRARQSSATRTKLNWTAATDNVKVTGYRVYRVYRTGAVRSVKTTTSRYAYVRRISGARYFVRAFDAAGNLGPRSPLARP